MLTLYVVQTFDLSEDGELGPNTTEAFESAGRATRAAKALATKHAGVLAWSRDADRDHGEYGPLTVLFQAGRAGGDGVRAVDPTQPDITTRLQHAIENPDAITPKGMCSLLTTALVTIVDLRTLAGLRNEVTRDDHESENGT